MSGLPSVKECANKSMKSLKVNTVKGKALATSPYFNNSSQKSPCKDAASIPVEVASDKEMSFSVPCSVYCPKHLKYVKYEQRKLSFKWVFSEQYYDKRNPTIPELARAGFFYDNENCRVVCYSCGKGLYQEYFDYDEMKFMCKESLDHYLEEDCPRAPKNIYEKYEFLSYVPKHVLQ